MTSTQEFNCVFCKESFDSKEELQIHFRKHGDPKFNQSLKVKSRPQNEAQTSNEKQNEDIELVSCDVCSEVFPTISKAITHKHKVHPDHDAKYFCPWCGKLFTMKHLHNKHLQTNHKELEKNDKNFHCDVCNVDFHIASAMVYHNNFFHRQDTDLPSIGQSKKLRMINKEILQIYYCAFCGDEFENKVNLHKHMVDDHDDENHSPEDVLRCPICEAIFFHLDAYELHLTFHSTDDIYTENNELFEQITEFSLETVPPLMERVENVESQDAEDAMNTVGIDKFLEMAMGSSIDKDNDNENPKKTRKHKKHKKSKKSAITLDEFLNMNQDVFGEGLDIQGVEEVPSQSISRRIKQKKVGRPMGGNLKVLETTDLEKLKKQGVIIKMKPSKKQQPRQAVKIGNKLTSKVPAVIQQLKKPPNVVETPVDVLSKLLNQSNTQIKVVKMSSQSNTDTEPQDQQITTSDIENIATEKISSTPKHIELKCDATPSGYTSSETEAKEEYVVDSKESYLQKDHNPETLNLSTQKSEPLSEMNGNPEGNGIKSNESIEMSDTSEIEQRKSNEDKKYNVKEKECDVHVTKFINVSEKTTVKSDCQSVRTEEYHNVNKVDKTKVDVSNAESVKSSKELNTDYAATKSLEALKHLSHLITIKPVHSKLNDSVSVTKIEKQDQPNLKDSESGCDQNDDRIIKAITKKPSVMQSREKKDSIKSFEALKSLNKNITVKPLIGEESESSNFGMNNHPLEEEQSSPLKTVATIKHSDVNVKSPKHSPKIKQQSNENHSSISEKIEKQNANVNLLKHLPNITAKPLHSQKTSQMTITHKTSSNIQMIEKKNIGQNEIKKREINKEINEEIEIFNIDDSDSDEEERSTPVTPAITRKIDPADCTSNKSLEKFKLINKNVTVKALTQQTSQINKNIVKQISSLDKTSRSKSQGSMSDFSDEDDDLDTLMPTNLNINQRLSLQSSNIRALQNLGKHITVKSRNSSPNMSTKSNKDLNFSHDSRENMNDADSDEESIPGKVKITELNEDNLCDDEMENVPKGQNSEYDGNVSVQSPEGSNSDRDNNFDDETEGELSDVESQIQKNTLKKQIDNTQRRTLDLKNINKNITIKSLSKCNTDILPTSNKYAPAVPTNSNKELSIKPFKTETSNDSFVGKKLIHKTAQKVNQLVKQNVASNNQLNSINKEVTVKTFQTKTVIQEITTTVTKTIKTVNQTVKQQLQSTSQVAQPTPTTPTFQRIQGMKSGQNIKHFHGITVRQAAPAAGTKIRGLTPMTPARPPTGMGAAMRPSNQLVPLRPRFNPVRVNNPRMPAIKKALPPPSTSQPSPMIGRPLKISPSALNTNKRASEEVVGHFSCFKKPKESLIPVSDVPNFDNEQSSDSTVHYATSHSRSNFCTTTKTVKGNTVVTSTQMESENSSSQQLSKLNNLSGLKVVKTSQSKETQQSVQLAVEASEHNATKRNTLEAIEKLQKQGLLVKKPRVEINNYSEPSGVEDEYVTEEPGDD